MVLLGLASACCCCYSSLAAPHIAMALAFESASPERYIGPLGLVGDRLSAILWETHSSGAREEGPGSGAVLRIPSFSMSAAADAKSADAKIQHDVDRITPFLHVPEATRVFVLSLRDSLLELRYAAPFHPIQRETLPRIDFIQQPLGHSDWRATAFRMLGNRSLASRRPGMDYGACSEGHADTRDGCGWKETIPPLAGTRFIASSQTLAAEKRLVVKMDSSRLKTVHKTGMC